MNSREQRRIRELLNRSEISISIRQNNFRNEYDTIVSNLYRADHKVAPTKEENFLERHKSSNKEQRKQGVQNYIDNLLKLTSLRLNMEKTCDDALNKLERELEGLGSQLTLHEQQEHAQWYEKLRADKPHMDEYALGQQSKQRMTDMITLRRELNFLLNQLEREDREELKQWYQAEKQQLSEANRLSKANRHNLRLELKRRTSEIIEANQVIEKIFPQLHPVAQQKYYDKWYEYKNLNIDVYTRKLECMQNVQHLQNVQHIMVEDCRQEFKNQLLPRLKSLRSLTPENEEYLQDLENWVDKADWKQVDDCVSKRDDARAEIMWNYDQQIKNALPGRSGPGNEQSVDVAFRTIIATRDEYIERIRDFYVEQLNKHILPILDPDQQVSLQMWVNTHMNAGRDQVDVLAEVYEIALADKLIKDNNTADFKGITIGHTQQDSETLLREDAAFIEQNLIKFLAEAANNTIIPGKMESQKTAEWQWLK